MDSAQTEKIEMSFTKNINTKSTDYILDIGIVTS